MIECDRCNTPLPRRGIPDVSFMLGRTKVVLSTCMFQEICNMCVPCAIRMHRKWQDLTEEQHGIEQATSP